MDKVIAMRADLVVPDRRRLRAQSLTTVAGLQVDTQSVGYVERTDKFEIFGIEFMRWRNVMRTNIDPGSVFWSTPVTPDSKGDDSEKSQD